MLLASLAEPADREAVRVAGRALTWAQLNAAAGAVAREIDGEERVAVWAEPCLETVVAVVGALVAGVAAIPLNPRAGTMELEHILADGAPRRLLAAPGAEIPAGLRGLPARHAVRVDEASPGALPAEPDERAPGVIVYTSGTTGSPKGVVLSRAAIAANLDALAAAWEWTGEDVLVHGLPLFHVHGLLLGVLGPLRVGGRVVHVGRFTPEAVASELAADGTMLFAVPTMYRRLAEAAEADPSIADGLRAARLLVSGSAALPAREHIRIERLCGQRIAERYGLSECMIACAVRAGGDRRAGYVGPPLDGVELRLVDDTGAVVEARDDETFGEVELRGPSLFDGYLHRPDDTAAALHDGWLRTGDLATRSPDGYVRIVGRRATDLIETGGFRVGAGEVEAALLEHPAVAEAAVTGEPDDDLGERIVAWVVLRDGGGADERSLSEHVAALLAGHKRPRAVRFLAELPRNAMGKVVKARLAEAAMSAGVSGPG